MIKERIDKDYNSMLRTSLTSISKVNKTDVETLRTSFGVSSFHCSSLIAVWRNCQSFANVSKATANQLQNLPGFGQVKVKNIKNAFEKPFRNNATSSLATAALASQPPTADGISDKAKGKRKEISTDTPASTNPGRPARDPSPVWDIELDLDETEERMQSSNHNSPPPVFDIELDLN